MRGLRIIFQTPPIRALSSQRLPDGSERPGVAQLLVVLYEPGDPNPIGASGFPTAKPLAHYRQHGDLKRYTVPLSPSIRGEDLGPVLIPANVLTGLAENALVASSGASWRISDETSFFRSDRSRDCLGDRVHHDGMANGYEGIDDAAAMARSDL